MTANNRLWIIAGLIVMSSAYAVLVKKDPDLAAAISTGYTALLLTVLLAINVWKKP